MTTNKTTALIDSLYSALDEAHIALCSSHNRKQDNTVSINNAALALVNAKKSIAAFEQPAVREMTVEEVQQILFADMRSIPLTYQKLACEVASYSIAKLGTIRVVEG